LIVKDQEEIKSENIENPIKECRVKHGDPPEVVLEFLRQRLECSECKIILAEGWCKKCGVCISICPVKALSTDSEGWPKVNNEKCISCGTCELLCPDFAIVVCDLKNKHNKSL
jgi:2-oxoglutarate ferredoxin oxidoreductase subunit delta